MHGFPGLIRGQIRWLHQGHVGKTLSRISKTRNHQLDAVEQAPPLSHLRSEKEKFLRDIALARNQIKSLFSPADRQSLIGPQEEGEAPEIDLEHASNEALKVLQILRPDQEFGADEALAAMETRMANLVGQCETPENPTPPRVLNPRAFLLALRSIGDLLNEDLEFLVKSLGIQEVPAKDDGMRFSKLVNALFTSFPLRCDPSQADSFVKTYWPTLKQVFPPSIRELSDEKITRELRNHLTRVQQNKKARGKLTKNTSEYYSLAEDFKFDDFPLDAEFMDETVSEFPLEKGGQYLRSLVNFFSPGAGTAQVEQSFQGLLSDLEKIGLKEWLTMNADQLASKLPVAPETQTFEDNDLDTAAYFLQSAARDRMDLLDVEAATPFEFIYKTPNQPGLENLPENPHLRDEEIRVAVSEAAGLSRSDGGSQGGLKVADLVERELDFHRNTGPIEWNKDFTNWSWAKPQGADINPTTQSYVRTESSVDPLLKLSEFRQFVLETKRCGTMCEDGRVFFYRVLILVGNGKGTYGFGLGYGNTARVAKKDAALRALVKLEYLDFDPSRRLTTPVKAREFNAKVQIEPALGIKCNHKYLPMVYLLGLDNVKFGIIGRSSWVSRIKALRRALDAILSRKTLACMTGRKFADINTPGDNWVHWPDKWFESIHSSYNAKGRQVTLNRKHALNYKTRGWVLHATPGEVQPGWQRVGRNRDRLRWQSPIHKKIRRREEALQTAFSPVLH